MYFRLNPECYLIHGIKCGAIYDLADQKVYSLDKRETEIVTSCENNKIINGDENILKELKRHCIGNFYLKKTYIQKIRVGRLLEGGEDQKQTPKLYRSFLEINNLCNRSCWFCGINGIKRTMGCMGCNKWAENGRLMDLEMWKKLIDGLHDLDCKNIYICGGDLTLVWDYTLDIIDYAFKKFTNIYVTLHQRSISPDIINDLKNKSNIIIQTESIKNIIENNSTILLIMNQEDGIECDRIKRKDIIKDYTIDDINLLSNDHPIVSKMKIVPTNVRKFFNNVEYHPCLGHTLAICCNGDVIPCPMMRYHKFGNVMNGELYAIFEKNWERIYSTWKLNLDKIDKCSMCEFRYSCNDCRSLEESLTGNLTGKTLCRYIPTEGIWL